MEKSIYDPTYTTLIQWLRAKRKELGLTQEVVGKKLCVHRSWVGKVESQERRLDVIELYRLCQVYGVQFQEIEPLLKKRSA